MFEAIKSLNSKQRLIGFIFAVIITAATTILTVYFKTDDCSGISNQYEILVKNQEDLMRINNDLVATKIQQEKDILNIKSLAVELSSSEVDRVSYIKKYDAPSQTSSPVELTDMCDTILVSHRIEQASPRVVKVIKETPKNYKKSLDLLLSITNKYTKK